MRTGIYLTNMSEYNSWINMKQRCTNPNNLAYKNYGGRGITICERWQHSFVNFLEDMGVRPKGLTLDRIDNDGNYEPSNCRWATRQEQVLNRRTFKLGKNSTTGFKYVTYVKKDKMYRAQVPYRHDVLKSRGTNLGYFTTARDANSACLAALKVIEYYEELFKEKGIKL